LSFVEKKLGILGFFGFEIQIISLFLGEIFHFFDILGKKEEEKNTCSMYEEGWYGSKLFFNGKNTNCVTQSTKSLEVF
jgi:hypothetical protein